MDCGNSSLWLNLWHRSWYYCKYPCNFDQAHSVWRQLLCGRLPAVVIIASEPDHDVCGSQPDLLWISIFLTWSLALSFQHRVLWNGWWIYINDPKTFPYYHLISHLFKRLRRKTKEKIWGLAFRKLGKVAKHFDGSSLCQVENLAFWGPHRFHE